MYFTTPFFESLLITSTLLSICVSITSYSHLKILTKDELKGDYDIISIIAHLHKIMSSVILCGMLVLENNFRFCEFLMMSLFVPVMLHYYLNSDKLFFIFDSNLSYVNKIIDVCNLMTVSCFHKLINIGSVLSFYLIGEPRRSVYILLTSLIWCLIATHDILLIFSTTRTKAKPNLEFDKDFYNNRYIPTNMIMIMKLILVPLIMASIIVDSIALYENLGLELKVWVMYITCSVINIGFKIINLFDYYESSKMVYDKIKKTYFSKQC